MNRQALRQGIAGMQAVPPDQVADNTQSSSPGNKGENIFLFVPNLIGYTRIILATISLYFMPLHPLRCSFIYATSCLLDALDGYLARILDQNTKSGAVLDMVTDRCTTTCLMVFLATAMPRWAMMFQLLISLDLASHYVHMYATLSMGGSGGSHKNVDKGRSRLLHMYYSNKVVLFTLCFMNELFFLALYLLAFTGQNNLAEPQMFELIRSEPWFAGAMEIARANKFQSPLPNILMWLSVIPMLVKQYINVQQLIVASQWLAEGDTVERTRRE